MIRRLLTILLLCVFAFTATTLIAPSAVAIPIPGAPDCKDAPTPQMPGRGFSGSIDSGPTNIDQNATSVYETIEYPPQWHTYDLGCGGSARDPSAVLDTTVGNWIKGVATSLVALCNSLHRFVSPPTFLGKLDPLVIKGTASLRDALYTPWVNLSLLVLAVFIIFSARRQNLPSAVEMVVWALLVMGLVTMLFSYPVQAGHMADDLATSSIGQVNASMLGEPAAGNDPSSARAAILTDNVLYKQWLQGELGSSDSTVAKKYGRQLLVSQAYTYVEAKFINETNNQLLRDAITNTKKSNFTKIAAKIHDEDPDAYDHLKGQAGGRIGNAAWSLFAVLITTPFMIVADFLVIIGLLLIRLAIIVFPAVAVIGMHHKMRGIVITLGKIVAAALVNTIIFTVGAAVNALTVGVLLGGNTGLPMWANLLLCLAISWILWGALKPFRKLSTMASMSAVQQGATNAVVMPNTRRTIKQVLGVAGGVWAGAAVANLDKEGDETKPETKAAPTPTSTTTPRTEAWTRPALPAAMPVSQTQSTPMAATAASNNIRDVTNEHVVNRYEPPPVPIPTGTTPPATPPPIAMPQTTVPVPPQPTLPNGAQQPALVATTVPNPDVKPAWPGTPMIAPPAKHHESGNADIFAANEPLPGHVLRADPVMQDGAPVYRIWDAEAQDVITVNPYADAVRPNENGEADA